MTPLRTSLLAAAVLAVALSDAASAQTNSLFGSGGQTSRNTGTTGGRSSGSSMFGGTGGATGAGLGGLSQGGGLGGVGGNAAASGGPQLNQLGSLASQVGQGFIGQSNANGFIGAQRTATGGGQGGQGLRQGGIGNQAGNPFAGLGLGGQGGNGGRGGQNGRGNNNQGGNNNNNFGGFGSGATSTRIIRPQHRVAFTYTPVTTDAVATRIQTQLHSFTVLDGASLQGVTVNLDAEGKAVLRGIVDSTETRDVVDALIRLEPGVRSVVNELTVR